LKSPINAQTILAKGKKLPVAAALVAGLVVLIGLVWGGTALYSALNTKSTVNYAEEVARPLEEALVRAGGVKKGSGGDPGRGPDNARPYFDATYDLSLSKSDAISLINRIAEENGYKLTHASPSNRGHLGAVADIYIDAWYFDITSKQSPYSNLNEGPVKLAFKLGDEDRQDQPGHTTIRVSIQLPNSKL
jgi:hypothetical protein